MGTAAGGAVALTDVTTATFENVTFSDNTTDDLVENGTTDLSVSGNSTVTLTHVTIYNNVDTDNFSVAQDSAGGAEIIVDHTIIYRTYVFAACTESLTGDNYNLSNDDSCFGAGGSDLVSADDPFPGVSLSDNDGPVLTLPIVAASPAFNAGNTACTAAVDARGVARPQMTNCDIGAFESTCGNGLEEAQYGEACDDGDNASADGCSSLCEDETLWYADTDIDTFGDPLSSVFAVDQPVGHVADDSDCDDDDADISPDAEDICDLVDNDCNGTADDDFAADLGDACSAGTGACEDAGELVCNSDGSGTECDAVAGAAGDELCGDTIDNDCDGETDEGYAELGDACAVGVGACETSGVLVCSDDALSTECDAEAGDAVNEVCDDDIDNDCDGDVDADDADCADTAAASSGCALQATSNPRDMFGIASFMVIATGFFGLRRLQRES